MKTQMKREQIAKACWNEEANFSRLFDIHIRFCALSSVCSIDQIELKLPATGQEISPGEGLLLQPVQESQ